MIPVYPVYEQDTGRGVGITRDELAIKVISYPEGDRIAVLLRDFKNDRLRALFAEHDIFVTLDRLLGNSFHLFYADGLAIDFVAHVDGVAYATLWLATSDGAGGFTNVETKVLQQAHDALAIMELANVIRDYRDNVTSIRGGWFSRKLNDLTANVSANLIANGLASIF